MTGWVKLVFSTYIVVQVILAEFIEYIYTVSLFTDKNQQYRKFSKCSLTISQLVHGYTVKVI